MMIINLIRPTLDIAGLGDALLDTLEDYVERTDNQTDDKLVLPMIKGLRVACNIPDEEEEKKLEVVK